MIPIDMHGVPRFAEGVGGGAVVVGDDGGGLLLAVLKPEGAATTSFLAFAPGAACGHPAALAALRRADGSVAALVAGAAGGAASLTRWAPKPFIKSQKHPPAAQRSLK